MVAESEARRARLTALRYQLNPHFLFNSLNAASTLILDGNAPAASRMLLQIGGLLRTTLDAEAAAEVPFARELAFVQQYLAVERTRFGDRLCVRYEIDFEVNTALVPSMLLQPLVENAVHHGIARLLGAGTIGIQAGRCGNLLQIIIRNSGPNRSNGPARSGIGLANTRERLRMLYGEEHGFDVSWPDDGGCIATVLLPLRVVAQSQELACAH